MKSSESRKQSAKEIEFSADDLIGSLRGHADHLEGRRQITMRTTKVVLPAPVKMIKPRQILELRVRLNVSQPVFARLLNVPVATARSWEQGTRVPSGAALRLLDLAYRKPEILADGLGRQP